jgi:hypothetical protein
MVAKKLSRNRFPMKAPTAANQTLYAVFECFILTVRSDSRDDRYNHPKPFDKDGQTWSTRVGNPDEAGSNHLTNLENLVNIPFALIMSNLLAELRPISLIISSLSPQSV